MSVPSQNRDNKSIFDRDIEHTTKDSNQSALKHVEESEPVTVYDQAF